jgi:hypothetical protein
MAGAPQRLAQSPISSHGDEGKDALIARVRAAAAATTKLHVNFFNPGPVRIAHARPRCRAKTRSRSTPENVA